MIVDVPKGTLSGIIKDLPEIISLFPRPAGFVLNVVKLFKTVFYLFCASIICGHEPILVLHA